MNNKQVEKVEMLPIADNEIKKRELYKQIEELDNKKEFFLKEIEKIENETTDLKIVNSYKYLGKYIRRGNSCYYVADIGCEYTSCLCGVAGPNLYSEEKYFRLSNDRDSYNAEYFISTNDKIEFITKEEFEKELKESFDKIYKDIINNCKPIRTPRFLYQSDSDEVIRLRKKFNKEYAFNDSIEDEKTNEINDEELYKEE